jgi:hypothetical protein
MAVQFDRWFIRVRYHGWQAAMGYMLGCLGVWVFEDNVLTPRRAFSFDVFRRPHIGAYVRFGKRAWYLSTRGVRQAP